MKTPTYTRISIAIASALALAWVVWAPGLLRASEEIIAVLPFAGRLAAVVVSHNPKSIDGIRARYQDALAFDGAPVLEVDVVGSSTASTTDGSPAPVAATSGDGSAAISALATAPKVRILLVPGHEPSFGGAEYRNLKERDLAVELAQDLQALLAKEPRYQVFVTRDTHAWSPTFAAYFKKDWKSIIAWQKAGLLDEQRSIASGSTTLPESKVYHNAAPKDVALRLYGITKWANEHDIDIVINIHFNDDPIRTGQNPGNYKGFAVYVPVGQYGNASSSRAVGESILSELQRYEPISDLPGESSGIVDDPALIAVGANNSADAAALLIEYAYIYEPGLADPSKRKSTLQNMADYTYYGLQDFFREASSSSPRLTP